MGCVHWTAMLCADAPTSVSLERNVTPAAPNPSHCAPRLGEYLRLEGASDDEINGAAAGAIESIDGHVQVLDGRILLLGVTQPSGR